MLWTHKNFKRIELSEEEKAILYLYISTIDILMKILPDVFPRGGYSTCICFCHFQEKGL